MKKTLATILSVLILTPNLALAENWVFTSEGNYSNNTQYDYSVDGTNTYNSYSTPEAYYGTATTNNVSTPKVTNYKDQTLKTTLAKPEEKETFSQKHPILAGLGIGVLALGAVAVGVLFDDDDDDYHRHHDQHRHRDHHDSYDHNRCRHGCR